MVTRNLLAALLCCTLSWAATAQTASKRIFLISSDPTRPINYTNLREIDGNCKVLVKEVFDPQKKYAVRTHGFQTYLALQQSAFINDLSGQLDTLKSPMGGSVASMAYDQKSNRLFYFPMYSSELRFMDLNQPDPHFTYFDKF